MTDTTVQFLQDYQIASGDFPGAAAYQGGFAASDVAALPLALATTLISTGIAQAQTTPRIAAPAGTVVLFQRERTLYPADGITTTTGYLIGDRATLPTALAARLITAGFAIAE